MKKRQLIWLITVLLCGCLTLGCDSMKSGSNKSNEKKKTASTEHADMNAEYGLGEDGVMVMLNSMPYSEHGILKNDILYVPIELLKQVDDRLFWFEKDGQLTVTNSKNIDIYWPDQKQHELNGEVKSSSEPMIISRNGHYYVSTELIAEYGRATVATGTKPATVSICKNGTVLYETRVKNEDGAILRTQRDITNPIVAELETGTRVYMAENLNGDNWTKVMLENGLWGYINNSDIQPFSETVVVADGETYEHFLMENNVCMGWHQVYFKLSAADLKEAVKDTKGLNVISPTWFEVSDVEGHISSVQECEGRMLASAEYVEQAHKLGMQVWVLVDDFAKGVSGIEVLSNYEHRKTLISSLIQEVTAVGADGINIDFEYITAESGPHYIQFLRELYLESRKAHLVISIDCYGPDSGKLPYYNLSALKDCVDYVILMAYDENNLATYNQFKENGVDNKIGSASSLPFVTRGAEAIAEKVPGSQIILGLPFFSRKWVVSENGNIATEANGMDTLRKFVKDSDAKFSWDNETQQNFADFMLDGKKYKIWLEDKDSLAKKMDVYKNMKLAGCSFWKLGLESSDVWPVISDYTK